MIVLYVWPESLMIKGIRRDVRDTAQSCTGAMSGLGPSSPLGVKPLPWKICEQNKTSMLNYIHCSYFFQPIAFFLQDAVTCLHTASRNGDVELVGLLIDQKADIDCKDKVRCHNCNFVLLISCVRIWSNRQIRFIVFVFSRQLSSSVFCRIYILVFYECF